jgi:hypothetical protein
VPSGNEKSVFGMSSGTMRICSYASDISIIDTKGWDATALCIISWLGNGIESIMVFALCSQALITVQSFSSAQIFGIARSGEAFQLLAGFHQPAFT